MAPNVLFIITDQQRADHAGFMGNRVVRTPHLDALAARARVFDNAWVSNPVCMPNRSTILTGRMPSAHGVIFNDRTLDPGVNTFARRLRASGYRTGMIGKAHFQHGMSQNSMVPFAGEPALRVPYPGGWDEIENFERYLDGEGEPIDDFYGFDHVELAIDHGARMSGHHLLWAEGRGVPREQTLVPYSAEAPGDCRSAHWWQIYRPPYAAEHHSTSFVTEQTLSFIRDANGGPEPWLAWCSFPDPHHPMTPPGEWFHRHRPEDMPLPATRHDPFDKAPAHLKLLRRIHPRDQRSWVGPCGYGSDALLAEAIAATYGMIEMIDDGVGRILALLDELGERDNTIVVFTSDHGDMMGDHGLFLKGFMHYRGTLQVPLLLAGPGIDSGRTGSLASSIDLCPTLLELCGVEGYDGIQGQSLQPILDDPSARVRDAVLIEDDVADSFARRAPIPGKTRTLITEQFRYTRNSKGEDQLFDLTDDPDELKDLADTDHELRGRLVDRLTDALIRADDAARGAPATERF